MLVTPHQRALVSLIFWGTKLQMAFVWLYKGYSDGRKYSPLSVSAVCLIGNLIEYDLHDFYALQSWNG